MSEIISDDVEESLIAYRGCELEDYRMCDEALVHFWNTGNRDTWGANTGLISAPFTNVVTRSNEQIKVKSFCPSSGRFVYYTNDRRLVVGDLF